MLVGIALWAVASALVDWLLTRADIRDAALGLRLDHRLAQRPRLGARRPAGDRPGGARSRSRWPAAGCWACSSSATTPPAGSACAWPTAQAAAVLVAVGCVAAAVAAAGPIGFVALAVPQLALRLTGGSRPPVLASAVLGAVLVVGADLVARTLLPQALPVGILTAAIGAPYLLWLLVRGRRRSTL